MKSRQAKRTARAEALEQFIATWSAQGLVPVTVLRVYQVARRGSKAVLLFPGGQQVDAWFWWFTVTPGSFVMIAPAVGYGSHTHRDGVHYVGSKDGGHGVAAVMHPRDVRFLTKFRRST